MSLNIDMQQPFFPDGALDIAPEKTPTAAADALMERSYNAWIGFRSTANKQGVTSLLDLLGSLNKPVLLTSRRAESNENGGSDAASAFPWLPGADINYAEATAQKPITVFTLAHSDLPDLKPDPSKPVVHFLEKSPTPFAIDLTGVPTEDVAHQLDLWFVKA